LETWLIVLGIVGVMDGRFVPNISIGPLVVAAFSTGCIFDDC